MDHKVTWKLDKCPIFVFALVKIYFYLQYIIHSGKQILFGRTTIWTTFHIFLEVGHPRDTRSKKHFI